SNPSLSTQDQEFLSPEFGRVPSHPGIEGQAEQVAARPLEKHLAGKRQAPFRSARFGDHITQAVAPRREDFFSAGNSASLIFSWIKHSIILRRLRLRAHDRWCRLAPERRRAPRAGPGIRWPECNRAASRCYAGVNCARAPTR